jgi:hypothetical protein
LPAHACLPRASSLTDFQVGRMEKLVRFQVFYDTHADPPSTMSAIDEPSLLKWRWPPSTHETKRPTGPPPGGSPDESPSRVRSPPRKALDAETPGACPFTWRHPRGVKGRAAPESAPRSGRASVPGLGPMTDGTAARSKHTPTRGPSNSSRTPYRWRRRRRSPGRR